MMQDKVSGIALLYESSFEETVLFSWLLQGNSRATCRSRWNYFYSTSAITVQYRQPNKIMAYLTFHKWLVSVCNIHNDIWMVQTKTNHLGKVSYAIILFGWWYGPVSRFIRTLSIDKVASCVDIFWEKKSYSKLP